MLDSAAYRYSSLVSTHSRNDLEGRAEGQSPAPSLQDLFSAGGSNGVSSIEENKEAWVTPHSVANVPTALVMSVLTSAFSLATNALVYWVFSAVENKSIAQADEFKKLSPYPLLVGLGASLLVWWGLMVAGCSAELLLSNNNRARFALMLTLGVNSFVTALTIAFVPLFSSQVSLMKMLLSLGVGLVLDLSALILFVSCGNGAQYTRSFVSALHGSIKEGLENIIGEGSNFKDCGKALINCRYTSLWCCMKKGSSLTSYVGTEDEHWNVIDADGSVKTYLQKRNLRHKGGDDVSNENNSESSNDRCLIM
ncbi:MAG: hypothetical protein V4496_00830 [Pseudomonadota bacterium]